MTRRKAISLLIALLIFIPAFFASTCSRGQCLEMDIVILGDFSGSVGGQERFVIDAVETFTSAVQGDRVRFAVALFADRPHVVSELSTGQADLSEYRDVNATGTTNIESALQAAASLLLEEQNNSRKLIILISDGDVTDGTDEGTLFTARQINSLGIGICAVLIKSNSQKPEFMKEISGGCYTESDYHNLAGELKNLNLCL